MMLIDAFIQIAKDFREELTLRKKWYTIPYYTPEWVRTVKLERFNNGCLVDVGCHYGLVSTYFVSKTNQLAHGFDVNPRIHRLLQKNLPGTPFEKRFIVHTHGLSDHPAHVQSYSDSKYSGATTIDPAQVGVAKSLLELELKKDHIVEVKTLDSIAETLGKISVIKIDCEGSEPHVIRGAAKTIARDHPAIIFEALTPEKRIECESILHAMHYRITPIDARNFLAEWSG